MLGTLALVLYAVVAAGGVAMTLREHARAPQRRLVDLGAGLAACLAWPLLFTAVLWELRRRPA
ncbi:MAG: hypothetical protein ACK4OP_13265 [Gemmobacter sp.]